MEIKNTNRGYIVPIAIGILVVASLGLLLASWRSPAKDKSDVERKDDKSAHLQANTVIDETTLTADGANLEAQLKALDNSNSDIDNSLNDKSSI